MKHIGVPPRFLVAAAVSALVLAVPIAVLAHEHSDQTESQCRVCKVSAAETVVLHDGPALRAPKCGAGLHPDGVQLVPDPPATAPGAPRAPPA